ncbi:MAG: hypothetical protein Tsb0014_07850 [Pleurocapsa sp.]
MTQIFFPSHSNVNSQKIYCYTNNLEQVVIVRINDLADRHCERVVFPGEKFLFQADNDFKLEVYKQTDIGIIHDTIPSSKLKTLESV